VWRSPATGLGHAVHVVRSPHVDRPFNGTPALVDPERALIEAAQAGDAAAFRQIFVGHRVDVARLVHRVLGPGGDVEDTVQEVFVHVHRSLGSFRFDSKFRTWLYRLTLNIARMQVRRAQARPRFARAAVPETSEHLPATPAPDENFETRERVRALYRLLDTLGEKKREVLVLHDLEGMHAKDIAELLAIPVLTVRTRLFYARKELYAAMREEPELATLAAAVHRESQP
jgi:RNA polymerase sigma-70 factor, ECF subfamily